LSPNTGPNGASKLRRHGFAVEFIFFKSTACKMN